MLYKEIILNYENNAKLKTQANLKNNRSTKFQKLILSLKNNTGF